MTLTSFLSLFHSFSLFLFQKWIDILIGPSCYFHWLNEFLSAPHCYSVLKKHMAHLTLNYGFIWLFNCVFSTCDSVDSLRNHMCIYIIYIYDYINIPVVLFKWVYEWNSFFFLNVSITVCSRRKKTKNNIKPLILKQLWMFDFF